MGNAAAHLYCVRQRPHRRAPHGGKGHRERRSAATKAINGEVRRAAQAVRLATDDAAVIVATENVGLLARFIPYLFVAEEALSG